MEMHLPAAHASPDGDVHAAAPPTRRRDQTFDAVRGIGIILVVLMHGYRALSDRGLLPTDSIWPLLDYGIYLFHMPLFFILAGMMVDHSLRKGRKAFLADKAVHILYPYILWSIIYLSIATLFEGQVKTGARLEHLPLIAWLPPLHFWFLHALFLFSIVAAYVRNLPLLLAIAVAGAIAAIPGLLPLTAARICHFFFFFAIGIAFRRWNMRVTGPVLLASAIILLGTAWWGFTHAIDNVLSPWVIPAGVAGYFLVLALAGRVSRWPFAWPLAALGELSLAIYILHILVMSATRMVASRLGIGQDFAALMLLQLAAGLLVPILCYMVARRLKLLTLSGLGKDLRLKIAAG